MKRIVVNLKKVITLLLVISLIAISLVGCKQPTEQVDSNGENEKMPSQILVESSTLGGQAYSLITAITEIVAKEIPEVTMTMEATSGYKENVVRMSQGIGDIGVADNAESIDFYNKKGEYADSEEEYLTALMLHTLDWNIIVREDSGINSVWDLEGKRVNKQPKGGTSESVSTDVLDKLGIKYQDFYMPHNEAAEAMLSKSIDAHIVMAAPAAFQELSTRTNLKVINFTEEDIQKVLGVCPYLTRTTFPAGQYYKGNDDVETFTLWAPLIVRADLPDEFVYKLVKGVYENIDILKNAHASGALMKPEQILDASVPVHPGAIKYYEEVGVELDSDLIP